jgi:putative tricarboxylic transport membrane protein
MQRVKMFEKGVSWLACLLILGCSACFSGARDKDEDFPAKPIQVIVPAAAGGGTDTWTRALAAAAEDYLGRPIMVVNKKGAAGAIGISAGMKAEPDGYTLTSVFLNIIFIPYIQDVPAWFDYRNVEPVCLYNIDPGTVSMRADAPWQTLDELIQAARAESGTIKAATAPPGGAYFFVARAFEEETGTRFRLIPYGGANPAVVATAGGHIDITFYSPAEVLAQVEAGNIRVLAVMSEKSHPLLPGVPTLSELGIKLVAGSWRGITAPKGTPEDRIEILHQAFKKALESEAILELSRNTGFSIDYLGPDAFGKYMDEENRKYQRILEKINK